MAIELAAAYVSIVPSLRGAGRQIQGELSGVDMSAPGRAMGQSLGQRIGSSVKGVMGDTWNAIKGTAAVAFAGIGAVLASNLNAAISRADQLNNFPKVMANLGYDAGEAATEINRIAQALDGLPTATDTVVKLVQGFAPLSSSLKEATDLSLALNNAVLAGGASQELQNNALEQYRQMLSVGKVDMMAWRSMQGAMIGQLEQLSRALLGAGANSTDLYNAMRDGEVTFDDFNEALLNLNENGIDGLASFEEQARSATSGIGTAFTNARTRVAAAMEKIISAIGVEEISGRINAFTSQFTGWGQKIADFIESIKDGTTDISGITEGLGPMLGLVAGFVSKMLSSLPVIGRFLPAISGPVGLIIGLFVQMWTNSERLRNAITDLFTRLSDESGSIMPILNALGRAIGWVSEFLGDVLALAIENAVRNIEWLADKLEPLVAWVQRFFQAGTKESKAFKRTWDDIQSVVESVVNWFNNHVRPAFDAFVDLLVAIDEKTGIWNHLKNTVKGWWDSSSAVISAATTAIKTFWSLFGDDILRAVAATFVNLGKIIGGALTVITGIFQTAAAIIRGDWSKAWDGIKKIASGAWSVIKGIVGQGWNVISTLFRSASSLLSKIAGQIWDGIQRRFRAGVDRAAKTMRSLPGQLRSAMAGAKNWLIGVGRDAALGLWNGIKGMGPWLRGQIGAWAKANVTLGFKVALGIASPSRVMADEVGRWILPGVTMGMDKTANDFRRDVASALDMSGINATVPSLSAGPFAAVASGPASAGGRVELTITNWQQGKGYFEQVADGRIRDDRALASQHGRQF